MILVTGAGGLLGSCLADALKRYGADVVAPVKEQMDITNSVESAAFFAKYHPDVVIHCAAYSKVDLAEEQQELCRWINVCGTQVIADLCKREGAYLLYISSDYVFDGTKTGLYEVYDRKNPLSVYGRSKSEGEDIVLSGGGQSAVLRTSWLFGHARNNFVETILRIAREKDAINVVSDQVGSPTYTEDLVMLILEMIEKRSTGIYHGTNEGVCSWAEFAERILAEEGLETKVCPIKSEEYMSKAVRPANSRLSKVCLDEAGLARLPQWEDALKRYLNKRKDINKNAVV